MDGELNEKYQTLLDCASQLVARSCLLSCGGNKKLTKQCQSELAFLQRVSATEIVGCLQRNFPCNHPFASVAIR